MHNILRERLYASLRRAARAGASRRTLVRVLVEAGIARRTAYRYLKNAHSDDAEHDPRGTRT